MRRRFDTAVSSALVLLLTGISSATAKTVRLEIAKLAFVPAGISVQVGDTVEWTSSDFVAHTATARDKAWDVSIPAKGTGSVVLKSAGTIEYYCRFHPNMKGTITVEQASAKNRPGAVQTH
jgi:plastocyanin